MSECTMLSANGAENHGHFEEKMFTYAIIVWSLIKHHRLQSTHKS